ncbi:MAG TPA: glycosyltransferase [Planosporangium sp.]|nr:glycosyltransferase [Planosporangium sp.]
MAELQGTSSRAAILLPTAGHPAHATALDLARRVAASGCEVITIEPRRAETAALHDAGPDGGLRRFTLDVPAAPDAHAAFFGCTPAERLVAQLLADRQIDVVHAHLAGDLVVVPMLERAWLLGIPLVATVHNGWSPDPCADRAGCPLAEPARARLAERLARHTLARADLVCAPDARGAEAASGWLDQAPRVMDDAGPGSGSDWADLYRRLAGDPDPPCTALTLSAIVTTYQRHAVLRDCLEALANQTLPRDRFEVVVVDDASQPSAGPVVEGFRDRLDVRFVRLDDNVGLGEARNRGIDASRGDVLFFLDDDDEPAPRCLAEHLRTHAEHGDEFQAVLGWTGPAVDQVVSVEGWLAFWAGLYISHWMRHLAALDWFAFWGGRSSIRRDFLGDDRFELPFLEDADLGYRLSRRGLRVTHNRHAVQRVRIGLDAASLLRRAGRFGQARANMVHCHPQVRDCHAFSPDRYARSLAGQLPQRASARLRTLTWGTKPAPGVRLEALRANPDPYGDGSCLERLAADLHTLSAAEAALGWALGCRRIAAREAGRPLRIGVSLSSPLLPELASRLRAAPPGSATLVVAAPPGMSRARLDAALASLHAEHERLELEPLLCDSLPELWEGCDVVAAVTTPTDYDPSRQALPLPRGPLAESLQRLLHLRDLVGVFR